MLNAREVACKMLMDKKILFTAIEDVERSAPHAKVADIFLLLLFIEF